MNQRNVPKAVIFIYMYIREFTPYNIENYFFEKNLKRGMA